MTRFLLSLPALLIGFFMIAVVVEPPTTCAQAAGGDVIEVEVEGEGISKESATNDALRKALEKGGKNEIFSDTKVENFQLIHDTIITRAEGIVTDYQVLKGYPKQIIGGTWKVKIKARVSKKILKDAWGAVQNVLDQIGRPKVMVYIVERIDGQEERQSILETEIEKRLLKSGFDLVDRNAVKSILEKEKADAAAENNVAKIQAIAKGFDAQIFLTGTANANQAGLNVVHGVSLAAYNCDVQLKAYYTDSAKIIGSAGIANTRGLVRGKKEFSPQAGKQALAYAGKKVVEEIYSQVMKQWATQISAGGELILEVQGMKFKGGNQLKKALQEVKNVNRVNFKFSKGIARFRINAKMGAQDLAEILSEGPFEAMLEIQDLTLNRIQATAAGG